MLNIEKESLDPPQIDRKLKITIKIYTVTAKQYKFSRYIIHHNITATTTPTTTVTLPTSTALPPNSNIPPNPTPLPSPKCLPPASLFFVAVLVAEVGIAVSAEEYLAATAELFTSQGPMTHSEVKLLSVHFPFGALVGVMDRT
jgi:hypothetical protein